MLRKIEMNVNGKEYKLEVDIRESLLEVLREKLNLKGAKKVLNRDVTKDVPLAKRTEESTEG